MRLVILLTLMVAVAFIGTAMAVPPGKTIDYENSMGKVVFSGKTHADAGGKCMDCHPKIFQMKTNTFKMTLPHKTEENCGTCHDGEKAFSQKDTASCKKCHKK